MPATTRLPVWDLLVLLVYLAVVVGMGFWIGRRNRTPRDFMAAGGRLPGWAVGLSILGTYVSSISFLAVPGRSYGADWNTFVFSLSLPIAAWVAVRFFVPFYRRSGEVSAYHHLEGRFGPWARTYAVACYLATQLARMGTIQYLVALALEPLTGWSLPTIILITGSIVICYSLVGGIEAVIWTDVVQTVVLIGGALACLGLLVFGLPEGPGQFFRVANDAGKFSLGSYSPSLNAPTFWVVLIYGLVINLQNFGIDQNYVQRYAASRDEREARRSVWLGALAYVPVSALFLLIGTALYVHHLVHPGLLPEGTPPDKVFPHFIAHGLPVGLSGVVVAAVFAAAQSTLSSSVNGSATLFLCDLYRRFIAPDVSDRTALNVLRWATVGFGLAGTCVALALIRVQSAMDVWWKWSGILSGGMLGLFLLGILVRRASRWPALAGVVLGVLVICWMTFSPGSTFVPVILQNPLHEYLVIVVATLTILFTGWLLSCWKDERPKTRPQKL